MSCLNKIVTLGLCPDEEESLSGFKLIQAAGISQKVLADIANETYIKGANLAMEKKSVAIAKVKNDFLAALQSNGVVTQMTNPTYSAGVFNTSKNTNRGAAPRGIRFHKAAYRGSLRKTFITAVQCYPLQSGNGKIKIILERNGFNTTYSWDVAFVANQLNVFDKDIIEEFPFEIPADCKSCRVVTEAELDFCSTKITCLKGCNGSLPNPCGWIEGWDGSKAVKDEGYGVNVEFQCVCDYEKILCDLSKSFSGELIYLKWQMEVFEEAAGTNRFNNLVIYGAEQIRETILPNLSSQYVSRWNALMAGTFDILKTYRDECLNCRGIRWKTNM